MKNGCAEALLAYVFAVSAFQQWCAAAGGVEVNVTVGSSLALDCEIPIDEDLPLNAQLVWTREGISPKPLETLGAYMAGSAYAAVVAEYKILKHSGSQHVQFAANQSGTDDNGTVLRFPLFLQSVTITEERRYDCRTDTGRTLSTYIVNVLGPPHDLHLSMNFTVVDEGEKVRLVCTAAGKPAPQYVWLDKEGRELPSTHGIAQFIATLDVAGSISCKAFNEFGESRTSASIVVRYKPKIVVDKYVAFRPDGPLHLTCSYHSIPEAIAVWTKDGSVVDSSRGFREEKTALPAKNAWQLVAKKDRAVLEDAGVYVCQANNSLGSSASRTKVKDMPYGTTMDAVAVGDTWARLLLTTNSAVKVTFCLNITALNSPLLVERRTLYVPGQWQAVGKVRNDYKLALKPATRYHIELKVLTDAELIASVFSDTPPLDVDADVVEVSARVDFVTSEVSKKLVIDASTRSSLDCILLPNSIIWSATTTLRWIKGESIVLADYLLGEAYANISAASRLIKYENAMSDQGSISSVVDTKFEGGVNFKLQLTNINVMVGGNYTCMAFVKSTTELASIVSYNVVLLDLDSASQNLTPTVRIIILLLVIVLNTSYDIGGKINSHG